MTLFDPGSLATTEVAAGAGDDETPASHDDSARAERRVRIRLSVAYDGTGFRGFAAQDGQRTVAGELSGAIAKVARHPVELVCAGRTDAGVHATGQVVHVDVTPELSAERLRKAVNSMLGPAVVVRSAAAAPAGFDARRSARSRHYRYLVLRADTPDPLLARLAWHVRDHLDLRSMAQAADVLVGEHDFSAFCKRPPGADAARPIVRRVLDARLGPGSAGSLSMAWTPSEPASQLVCLEISAQSFCHQMVRSVMGTLVDVGRGRRRVADVVGLLRSGDRSHATTVAPPHGLCLVKVDY